MTDWSKCLEVEQVKERVSGACVFTGTRFPLAARYENLTCGATVREFTEWLPGVSEQQTQVVLNFEAASVSKDRAR